MRKKIMVPINFHYFIFLNQRGMGNRLLYYLVACLSLRITGLLRVELCREYSANIQINWLEV